MRVHECVAVFSRIFFLATQVGTDDWRLIEFNSRLGSWRGSHPISIVHLVVEGEQVAVLSCSLTEVGIGATDPEKTACTFSSEGGVAAGFNGPIGSLLDHTPTKRRLDMLLATPQVASSLDPLVRDFLLSRRASTPVAPFAFNIDARVSASGAEVVSGWFMNFSSEDVAIVTGDLRSGAVRRECALVERRDVSAHLSNIGAPLKDGHHHGFCAVLPRFGLQSQPIFCIFRSSGGFTLMGPLEEPIRSDSSRAIEIVQRHWPLTPGEDFRRLTHAIGLIFNCSEQNQKPTPDHGILSGPNIEPIVSVVMSHYGSLFWFRSALQMQRGFPSSVEMIHVCDDPALAPSMASELASQENLLTCPTRLVNARGNLGYAGANNLGASLARAPILILMNSDIWMDSVLPLLEAADWLCANPKDILGFRLMFDDETVQHDGISIARDPGFADLYIAKHRGKGLPPTNQTISDRAIPRETEAVTGALLAITRSAYADLGGLDETFAWADYEDVDLCLRARDAGGKIRLIEATGIYHLEGQSMRVGPAAARRSGATLINAIRFNERWGKSLDGQKRSSFLDCKQ